MAAMARQRRFLKSTGAIVAGTAIAGAGGPPVVTGQVDKGCDRGPGFTPARPDSSPYQVDDTIYRRFSAAENCFNRSRRGGAPDCRARVGGRALERFQRGDAGFGYLDLALGDAVRTVGANLSFASCASDYRLDEVGYSFADAKPTPVAGEAPYRVDDPATMSAQVKQVARFLGADLAGVCRLDRRWVYSEVWLDDTKRRLPLELPAAYAHAVVLAFAMDYDAVATSPTGLSGAASGLGYSRMAVTITALAKFIRNLGYRAIASGNDTALSVPMAIDAGLGEFSRTGLLVTPEFGSRVRLAKVITDLPLEPDHPITFGVRAFCAKCKKCAKRCPAKCISLDPKPSWRGPSTSNNPGVLKWYVDVDRCLDFWIANGSDCLTCIVACPFNAQASPWRDALISTVAPGTGRAWVPASGLATPSGRPADPRVWWSGGKQ